MNREATEQRIEVMKAFTEGKTIESREKTEEHDRWWIERSPNWDWDQKIFRVLTCLPSSQQIVQAIMDKMIVESQRKEGVRNPWITLETEGPVVVDFEHFRYRIIKERPKPKVTEITFGRMLPPETLDVDELITARVTRSITAALDLLAKNLGTVVGSNSCITRPVRQVRLAIEKSVTDIRNIYPEDDDE
jgi:hypothetical protein